MWWVTVCKSIGTYPKHFLNSLVTKDQKAIINLNGRNVYTNSSESAHWKNPYTINFSSSCGIFIKEYTFSRRAENLSSSCSSKYPRVSSMCKNANKDADLSPSANLPMYHTARK